MLKSQTHINISKRALSIISTTYKKPSITGFYKPEKEIILSKRELTATFKPPPKMVSLVWDWVLPRYASIVYQNTQDIKLKETAGKDCNFNPQEYQNFQTSVPIDLSNWYDIDITPWKDVWSHINVNIYSTYEDQAEYVGRYMDQNNSVDIVFLIEWLNPRTINEYNNIKASIFRNIEHELVHTAQYIFKHFKNLLSPGGLPSKPKGPYTPEGQLQQYPYTEKEYYTRDIEFYALLNDEITRLKRLFERLPPDTHLETFKVAVGLIPALQHTHFASPFLLKLKEKEPKKWEKAVKELYKSLFKVSFLISKRAAEYIEKKKEESGNITYIYSPEHIKKRNQKKTKKIKKLYKSIKDLKKQVQKDLKDEEKHLPALATALIINTYERVGNPASSKERDTYGVTTWKKKHISFSNNKARIKYKGKAGVKQDKEVKPAYLVKELKELTKDLKPNDQIFQGLSAKDVNKYLSKFNITAKDIRGFFANEEMIKRLKQKKNHKDEKERKQKFKDALEETAKIVGHTPSTLKNQYLMPYIEDYYLHKNKMPGF